MSDVCYTAVGTLAYILGRKKTARTIWNSIGDKHKNLTNKDLPGIEKQIKSSKIFKDTISDIANEALSKNAQLEDIFINYSNNIAYCHQELGHINPYDIRIEFKYEVK